MRPDQRWFPTNRIDRAAWFSNFSAQFTLIGPALGFSQAVVDAVAADNAAFQFAVRAITSLESEIAAVRAFERSLTLGSNNGRQANFPAGVVPEPVPMVNTGIFERLERLVRRIRTAPDYTEVTGSILGINPVHQRLTDISDFVPTMKAAAISDAYSFTVRCAVKSFGGFRVSYRRFNSNEWESGRTFFRSPATMTIQPQNPGLPEQIAVRIRMIKRNDGVGQYSESNVITVVP